MREYHKIQTIYKRERQKPCRIIEGAYSTPEIEYLASSMWEFTEKVDGTNIRVMWDGVSVRFGGKTDAAQIPATLIDVLTKMFLAEKMRDVFNGPACLYGEGYGAKIQKGGGNYKAEGQDFVLFDVLCGDWWLERDNVIDVATKCGVRVVPVIGRGTLADAVRLARDGFHSKWGTFNAEGIVARPTVTLFNRKGERIITKIKHRDFQYDLAQAEQDGV